MTPSAIFKRGLFIWLIFGSGTFQICSAADKSPFALTDRNVEKITGPADIGYIDEGYEWGMANLGFMLNGHGLPDSSRTYVIAHLSVDGKTELIWPTFAIGETQANVELLDHTLVFTAWLPDGSPVLMAHRVGKPPTVITEAVLRLAAKRLGTKVILPQTNYYFTKVRQPPDRIWLKGEPLSSANMYLPPGVFTLELTVDDLRNVIAETKQRGTLHHADKFDYFSEADPICLSLQDVQEIEALPKTVPGPATAPVVHKIAKYTPRTEDLFGDVLLDLNHQYAYFGTYREPGRILKVAMGQDPKTRPEVTGVAVLEANEDKPFTALMDAQNGYAYYGTYCPGHIVKLALGSSNTAPYRVGSILIDEDWSVVALLLDPVQGYGYFQVGPRLIKVRLGKGDIQPAIVSQMELPKTGVPLALGPGLLDPTTHNAYFGSSPYNKIYKVALGEGDAPPRFVGSITPQPGEAYESFGDAVAIDPTNGFAWFVSSDGDVAKVFLGATNAPPRLIGMLKLGPQYQYLQHTFGQDNAGYIYLGTMGGGKTGDPECCLGGVMKVAMGKGNESPRAASFMALPDAWDITGGAVDPEKRILYLGVTVAAAGCKILKIDLGEGDATPKVLASSPLYFKHKASKDGL